MLYLSMVRPVMEYGVAVWGCASPQSMLLLERVQRSALLSMSGADPSTSTSALQVYCGVPPLSDRLEYLQMGVLHRVRRLSRSHPIHCLYVDRRSRPSRTRAPSNSFLTRVCALEARLLRFCDVSYGDDSLAEPLDPVPANLLYLT